MCSFNPIELPRTLNTGALPGILLDVNGRVNGSKLYSVMNPDYF